MLTKSRFFLLAASGLLLGCNAVLGLEDVKLKKGGGGSAGSAGMGGTGAAGGAATGGGGAARGGTAGASTGGSGGGGTDCAPGEYLEPDGAAGSAPQCVDCPAGTYSDEVNAPSCLSCPSGQYSADPGASVCVEWTTCEPGTFVNQDGSATRNRDCDDCPPDTESIIENQSECLPPGACPPGHEQIAPGTGTDQAMCEMCEAGTFCPGGDTPKTACSSETWDHDEKPGTTCAARSNCQPGWSVRDDGSATEDRSCQECLSGTFSSSTNAASCTPCANGSFSSMARATSCPSWTACPAFHVEDAAGTPESDRTCKEGGWTRQFGTNGLDYIGGVSVEPGGNVYVSGSSSVGTVRGFLMKYDGSGTLLWTQQIGISEVAYAYGVSAAGGNVYVVGSTAGTFPQQTSAGFQDAYVMKYDGAGTLLWTRQFGTANTDNARGVTVDASGNVYVVGDAGGALPGQTSAGFSDAFLVKYDSAGTLLWARQLGSDTSDYARGVGVDSSNRVYIAGSTRGTLPAQTSAGVEDAFIARYSSSGVLAWTRQFGSAGADELRAVSVEASGNVYIAGSTLGVLSGQTNAGGLDAFAMKYTSAGTWEWTRQFGTGGDEEAFGVSVDTGGNIKVAGSTTAALPEQTSAGNKDAFVTSYYTTGMPQWTRQFGSSAEDSGAGVGTDSAGKVYVVGLTKGELSGQPHLGNADVFLKQIFP